MRVPRENIILGEGEGLKLALMTLNTGRLTLPAASTGIGKWCLYVAREWSKQRKQWGAAIGEHESIALKLGYIASHTFAMDALSWLTSSMADDKKKDIRLEAAIAKYFCTEHSWKIVDETLQIRGGQGYEQASSLKARGAIPWPVERVMRDVRINLIIEGTSEIMCLFIAREAIDPHLSRAKPLLSGWTSVAEKLKTVVSLLRYYAVWYTKLWLPSLPINRDRLPPVLKGHIAYVQRTSKRLARHIIHIMAKYQQKLEAKQSILNRIVDIGTDLLVMAAACSYAEHLSRQNETKSNSVDLADAFCLDARKRIEQKFSDSHSNHDRQHLKIAKKLLAEEYKWLENDIIK